MEGMGFVLPQNIFVVGKLAFFRTLEGLKRTTMTAQTTMSLLENIPPCRQRDADMFLLGSLDVDRFALRRARRRFGAILLRSGDQAIYSVSLGAGTAASNLLGAVSDGLALVQLSSLESVTASGG